MRYLMMALVAAFLAAPLMGCQTKTETDKNPITGSTTTTHSVGGN